MPEILRYQYRTQIEERFRQFKAGWSIDQFPSPHRSLMESHLCFTLFTYSLLQLYLSRKEWRQKTSKMIETLKHDEALGKENVLVYAGSHFGVLGLADYTTRVAHLENIPKQKLIATMEAQIQQQVR